MPFRITALPLARFEPLFSMGEDELAAHNAMRVTADTKPGYPCRVSLVDAEPGETLILVHHEHQSTPTPFRASHAIYVRERATQATPAVGEEPAMFRARPLSLRGFDAGDMLVAAELVTDGAVAAAVEAMLGDSQVAYLHAHLARHGCFAARIDRA